MNATEIEIAAIEATLTELHNRIRKLSDASSGDSRSVLEQTKAEINNAIRTIHVAGLIARDDRLHKLDQDALAKAREHIAARAREDGETVFAGEVLAGSWDHRHDVQAAKRRIAEEISA